MAPRRQATQVAHNLEHLLPRRDRRFALATKQHMSSIAKANKNANLRRELALLRSLAPEQLCFAGQVIIDERAEALLSAQAACPSPRRPARADDEESQIQAQKPDQQQLTFWADGCKFYKERNTNAIKAQGAAVVWYHQVGDLDGGGVWQERVFSLRRNPLASSRNAMAAELTAIAEALAIALEQILRDKRNSSARKVVVFSDCQDALLWVDDLRDCVLNHERLCNAENALARKVITRSQYLSSNLGVEVELRWVPGHSNIEGNVRADQAARSAPEHGPEISGIPNGVYLDEALELIMPDEATEESKDASSQVKKAVKRSVKKRWFILGPLPGHREAPALSPTN